MKLAEVLALPETDRYLVASATVHRFLESLAIQREQGWVTDDEFVRFSLITLKRGVAICEGNAPLAETIEAEGVELQKAINARQKTQKAS